MAIGGCGVISVVANIVPDKMSALTKAVFKGDLPKAEQLHRALYPLCRAAFLETNPMPVKAALSAMGRIRENLRLPLVRMSAKPRAELMDVLRDMGVV
jgi:4-hydroxy-tetrahydrodipicolinate synthase